MPCATQDRNSVSLPNHASSLPIPTRSGSQRPPTEARTRAIRKPSSQTTKITAISCSCADPSLYLLSSSKRRSRLHNIHCLLKRHTFCKFHRRSCRISTYSQSETQTKKTSLLLSTKHEVSFIVSINIIQCPWNICNGGDDYRNSTSTNYHYKDNDETTTCYCHHYVP